MYVQVIRSAVRYTAKGKTEVEEGSGGGLNISVQLIVVDLGHAHQTSTMSMCNEPRPSMPGGASPELILTSVLPACPHAERHVPVSPDMFPVGLPPLICYGLKVPSARCE